MRSAVIVLAGVCLVSASLPAATQSTTYGATVTVEEGVRVIRPLPPQGRVRIDADGKEQALPGSGRTYLHRIGDQGGANRYLRRVGEPRTERGIP